ncbi:MAG: hypothetical protein KDC44_11485 [Phaeodactylibacter sp.]|nr:hypothetical protein [Phaeodactylibacter sp.]
MEHNTLFLVTSALQGPEFSAVVSQKLLTALFIVGMLLVIGRSNRMGAKIIRNNKPS